MVAPSHHVLIPSLSEKPRSCAAQPATPLGLLASDRRAGESLHGKQRQFDTMLTMMQSWTDWGANSAQMQTPVVGFQQEDDSTVRSEILEFCKFLFGLQGVKFGDILSSKRTSILDCERDLHTQIEHKNWEKT